MMNSAIDNFIVYNGYPLSVVLALGIHSLLFVFILYVQSISEADTLEIVQPTIIKALLIDENPQVVNQRNQQRRAEEERLERERQRQQRIEEERRLSEIREREELERQLEAQRQREEARREAERREAARREEARREEARREEARREEARREEERRAEELRRQEELAEQERQRREAEAAAEAAAAEAARNEFELVQSASGLIRQLVEENWSRPPSARNGMLAILQISMLPTGELLEVVVTRSSGDPAFDQSAETAVYRAAPFAALQNLPINVFNENFRSFSLSFQPEDLLN